MTDSHTLIDRAAVAVAAAMSVAREIQHGVLAGSKVDKHDGSPVTVADFAVQAIVSRMLGDELGSSFRMIAEESSAMLHGDAMASTRRSVVEAVRAARKAMGRGDLGEHAVLEAIDLGAVDPSNRPDEFWTLDPIDGTKGFVRGRQYAVCLARVERGEVTLAVLGCPNLPPDATQSIDAPTDDGTLLVAELGEGCWQRPVSRPRDRGVCVRRTTIDPLAIVRLCDSVEQGRTSTKRARILGPFGDRVQVIQLDSQAKYAMLARGQCDVYLRPPRPSLPVEHIWDHAAGTLVAAEAGATVTDLRGQPLDFGQGQDLSANCGVVACAPEIHATVLRGAAAVDLDPYAVV